MNRIRRIDLLAFVLMSIVLVWWRAHTFAPQIEQALGWKFWAEMSGATEPLDCDEAAYGYMARRMASGAVMYRDLTEYKPPGGYWFYGLAIAIAGASEMTVRLMVLPVLVATLWLVGSIAAKLSGTLGAVVAMAVFVLMSTDPYVFGNGSNLEHLMNLGCTAAVWAFVRAFESNLAARTGEYVNEDFGGKWHRRDFWLFACGICVGLAATVKQVALIALLPIAFEFARSKAMGPRKVLGLAMIIAGFAVPWVVAIAILAGQGALAEARADIFEYSRALAADTPADANAPVFAIRWLTGNSDPRNGALPWPFGKTDWLVWWGTGAWPMHALAAVVFGASLVFRRARATPVLRVVIWQYPLAWGMIALPGLFWQHYYLLLAPVTSLLAGLVTGFARTGCRHDEMDVADPSDSESTRTSPLPRGERPRGRGVFETAIVLTIVTLVGMTVRIQWREYFEVPAEMLTVKYKGGGQWVSLRQLGRELKDRTDNWQPRPTLEVWGWQSPLLFYSGLDAPDRYFFTDPLAKSNIGSNHPLTRPRIERLTESLKSKRPELIFCGDVPFPELKAMLARDYIASSLVGSTPDFRGLYVRKDKYQDFHSRIVPSQAREAVRP